MKAQERGRLKDISGLIFKYFDTINIVFLEEQLNNYRDLYEDLYVDRDSYVFDQERYDMCIDSEYPGYKEFFELINLLNDKIKIEHLTISFDSDSD